MNRKIASEFAIGVILLVAFVVAGISWLDSVKISQQLDDVATQVQVPNKQQIATAPEKTEPVVDNSQAVADCEPHYYEGKDKFSAWVVSEDEDGIVMAIKKDEVSKLPITIAQASDGRENFTVKLIDPTDTVKERLQKSSPQKPATITIQGYAEICQQPPLVSLEKATIAFKGRS